MSRKQQEVIEYLLEENRILREQFDATGKRLRFNDNQRRRLAKMAKRLGRKKLMEYATLVEPDTLLAWHRKLIALKYTAKRKINTAGQQRMAIIRGLCVKFAEENLDWGYGRIQGALANLGYDVSATTVGNILRAKGIFPAPERMKRSTWKQFVRSHMSVMSVGDFFTTEVMTWRGLVRYYTFFVMKLETREVRIAHISCQVNGEVMCNVARELTNEFDGFLKEMKFFVCDNDPVLTDAFAKILEQAGIKVLRTHVHCPQQNGFAERFVKSIKYECLNRMIFFSDNMLKKAIFEYVEHYHTERNHQGLDNLIPFPKAPRTKGPEGTIVKSERLGGLLKYYYREPDLEIEKEEQKAA